MSVEVEITQIKKVFSAKGLSRGVGQVGVA